MITEVVLDSTGIGVRETHTGAVFLVGDRAYKLKKPVDMGFLDFGTRERRLRACRREVELNRRLAPDVYLGIADVTGPDGTLCDHLVVMRRMPDSRRLATLVTGGEPVSDDIVAIARLIARLHASADRSPEITAQGGRDALRSRWTASFRQADEFLGTVLDAHSTAETEALTGEFLAGRAPLFRARARQSRIVDGHGDLLTDDIFCLEDGPRILDCLEFDDQLRWVDGLDDVAFLGMDLERLGAPELCDLLLATYRELTGDPAPPALWHHYLAYRAFVRAKVACLRHAQHDPSAAALARQHADLALRHLRTGRIRLILVGGLPGTGKTTIAGLLADQLGAVLLSSDRVRKELAGINPEQRAAAGYGEGIYRTEQTERTYAELLRRAEELLGMGETVILDASWLSAAHRDLARSTAEHCRAPLAALKCEVDTAVAADRLRTRHAAMSDADEEIAARMAARAQPWPDAVPIPTDGVPGQAVTRALAAVRD